MGDRWAQQPGCARRPGFCRRRNAWDSCHCKYRDRKPDLYREWEDRQKIAALYPAECFWRCGKNWQDPAGRIGHADLRVVERVSARWRTPGTRPGRKRLYLEL